MTFMLQTLSTRGTEKVCCQSLGTTKFHRFQFDAASALQPVALGDINAGAQLGNN